MEKMRAASSLMVPKKFRSVREKNASHQRNRSSEAGTKTRAPTADSWLTIFKPDSTKHALKEKEEEKEAAKVDDISKRLAELNFHEISNELIHNALNSKFAAGDCDRAVELIQLQQKAFSGIIQPYNPNVEMLGAENRGNVTCYLDALLFAMFSKLQAFECMLKNDSSDEHQRKLAALLRLWVNMLRSGKLIHTDLTQHIQEALAACGWKEAELLEQQDTSEAFAFISETLQLPLLTLQVDLFHHGKQDDDDHKYVQERLLNLGVPPDPEGKGIKLEDCLEEYFNTQVDVLRMDMEDKKTADTPVATPTNTIRIVPKDMGKHGVEDSGDRDEIMPLKRRWTTHGLVGSPMSRTRPHSASVVSPASRARSTSIIQRIVVDGEALSEDASNMLQRAKRTGASVVKAVTIPAWQFFRLIPWHLTSNDKPLNDVEVAHQFNQRPVLGICLKRYTMTEQGVPKRHNTHIDIPDSMRLPHFMVVNDQDKAEHASNGLSQEYKLVLQSVVCHRGDSLHSGHYISFARVAPKLLTDNRRHDHDPPPDYEEAQWAKFDDLAEKRVAFVEDIKQSLRAEMPYLLFYQIVPMVDVTTASSDGSTAEPPSYIESALDIPGTPSAGTPSDRASAMSRPASGYFDSATTLTPSRLSIRVSSENERPGRGRFSMDGDPYALAIKANSVRRGSLTVSEPAATAPAITPEAVTPVVTRAATPQDESTPTRLSRAAAKFKTGSKSRPTSQAGDGRLGLTMSRFGFSRQSRDESNGASGGTSRSTSADGAVDEQTPVAAEDDDATPRDNGKGKEKEKEHHTFHHHHNNKKDRKSRDKGDKKEKGKDVPDRECSVM